MLFGLEEIAAIGEWVRFLQQISGRFPSVSEITN